MKIPIDEAPAGYEMDAAAAEALGLTVQWKQWIDKVEPLYFAGTTALRFDDWIEHEDWKPVPDYSTDIAAAWELLPRIQSAYGILLGILHDVTECKIMKDDKPVIGRAQDGGMERNALAICRAFLKANGIEYIETSE